MIVHGSATAVSRNSASVCCACGSRTCLCTTPAFDFQDSFAHLMNPRRALAWDLPRALLAQRSDTSMKESSAPMRSEADVRWKSSPMDAMR
eukprot:7003167-Pyramimonas_sp.AAC.1